MSSVNSYKKLAGSHPKTKNYKIAGLILAAGTSSRFGGKNKLLSRVNEVAMIRGVVHLALQASFTSTILVTGHQQKLIEKELKNQPIQMVHNKNYTLGMGTSIACGVSALPQDIDGVIIMLGDMPSLRLNTIISICTKFNSGSLSDICVPTINKEVGNPVLFGKTHFPRLKLLDGDYGGKEIICAYPSQVKYIETDDRGILIDYDEPLS